MASAGLMLCGPCLPWMTMVGAFLMHVMIKQLQCVLDSFQMTGSRPWLVSSFREGSKKKKKIQRDCMVSAKYRMHVARVVRVLLALSTSNCVSVLQGLALE